MSRRVIALVAVGAVLAAFVVTHSNKSDAPAPTTTAHLRAAMFEFDGPPEPAVVAGTTSQDYDHARLRVTMYVTHSKSASEEDWGGAGTRRTKAGPITLTSAIPRAELSQGDTVRAVFEAFDREGALVRVSERTWEKP